MHVSVTDAEACFELARRDYLLSLSIVPMPPSPKRRW